MFHVNMYKRYLNEGVKMLYMVCDDVISFHYPNQIFLMRRLPLAERSGARPVPVKRPLW